MYGAKPVIRSSSPVRGGAFACCGYLVLDGFAGVCEVWIFPGESLWDGEGPQARRCAASPPRAKPAKAARRAAWPAAQALYLAAICPARKWIFITLLNGRGILAQQKAGGRDGTLQEPAQSETRIFGPRTNEGKVGRKNTLQKVPHPAMIKGRTINAYERGRIPCPKRKGF